ncbi:MBOAT family O-acyltransferase [Devosia sp. Root635]|uniref:MBOAT family O-acyltransferase n=1 Tax=Devosia sp. Root635 TaxID=1736575 RepID=UPI00072B0F5D|nr:MBOAT family O-acyltransferase [Devosia sp. Root635]KRA44825.1 hypothetical protein ASD80_06725 [Devosia sp. Root635]
MALSDPNYLFFLATMVAALVFVPHQARLAVLVAGSIAFYLGFNGTILPLAWVVALAFGFGILLDRVKHGRARTGLFCLGLLLVLLPLVLYKFGPSVLPNASHALGLLSFPVGISFFSFAACGYLIDVYVGTTRAETNALRVSAFLTFFPTVSAGPIERKERFLSQLGRLGRPSPEQLRDGLRAILVGAFLKLVVADSLAPYVNAVFSSPLEKSGADLALGTFYFAFQVYADFAGYSLIALGSAALVGIRIVANFNQPYLAQTVPDFWRRWHISMSSWFRDYVFVPLQFRLRKMGMVGFSIAMVATFAAVGIWHGTGWQFLAFGILHGLASVLSSLTLPARNRLVGRLSLPVPLLVSFRTIMTFVFVCATLVLFRATSIEEALAIYGRIAGAWGTRSLPIVIPILLVGIVVVGDLLAEHTKPLDAVPRYVRWAGYYLATILMIVVYVRHLGEIGNYGQQFIYFRF